ncbi:MAG: O-antigen ligase family protein [Verrucomicrobiales bacterium]|nr:O-antigen ligase family protein [Verrucomicrobiales bacterium]
MASEKSLSLLRASLIFFLASLLLGSAAMYVQFVIVSVLVIWCFKWSGLKESIPALIKPTGPTWVMLLLFAGIFTATLLASDIVSISQMGELKWLIFPLVFALASSTILKKSELKAIEKVAIVFLVLLSVFSAIDSVYQVITGKSIGRLLLFGAEPFAPNRGSGLLKNPIPFAHVAGSLFQIGIAGAMISFSIGKQKLAAILSGLSLIFFLCVLSSLARGAWLAIALTALFSLVVTPHPFKRVNMIGLGVAALIGGLTLACNDTLFERFRSSFDPSVESSSIRLHLWDANVKMLGNHPFGIGFNANDILLPEKLAELGYPALSFQTHPHNEYLDYAVATGFPGVLLYLGVTIWLLVLTVKLLRRANLQDDHWNVFLLTASALVQSFLNACALTDQFSTPGRFLICLAWAIPIAIAAKNRDSSAIRN